MHLYLNELYINNINLIIGEINQFKVKPQIFGDLIRENLDKKSVALASTKGNTSILLCIVTKDISDIISAGDIIKSINSELGLKGGGSR